MKNIPEIEESTVVRTDFSDERVWQMVCAAIEEPVFVDLGGRGEECQANVTFVSDPAFEGITVEELVEHANKNGSFVFIVDHITILQEEHPILVVDLWEEPGRTFRVIPSQMWSVENNLSIANMDFRDFAESTDDNGVYRGFND
jgi:hypothetical protein